MYIYVDDDKVDESILPSQGGLRALYSNFFLILVIFNYVHKSGSITAVQMSLVTPIFHTVVTVSFGLKNKLRVGTPIP